MEKNFDQLWRHYQRLLDELGEAHKKIGGLEYRLSKYEPESEKRPDLQLVYGGKPSGATEPPETAT